MRRRRDSQRPLEGRRAGTRPEPAFKKRLRPVDDHLRGIEIVLRSQPVAFRACAIRRIEAERPRLELRHRNAAIGARQLFRVHVLLAAHHRDRHQAAREFQRRLDRLLQSLRDSAFQQQPVDDDLDRVILPPVERHRLIEIYKVAIHARADVALLARTSRVPSCTRPSARAPPARGP